LTFAIGDQRELAHDEDGPAGVEHASVELPVVALEDPQPRDLAGQLAASSCESSAATPSSTQSPEPISPTGASATVTRAFRTRWTTARTSY
jgi:hypothetical protein